MKPTLDELVFMTELTRQNGYLGIRKMSDGSWACVFRLMFHAAILSGRIGDFGSYENRWCYRSTDEALAALDAWSLNGGEEPEGWHRHPPTGRRREETGEEFIAA